MELMSVGVNYLREHIIQEARIHYAYLDAGGLAPNVVQPTGKVLYFIRAPHAKEVEDIFKRVVDIAKGAALMTGTTMEQTWDSACAEIIVNDALSRAMYDNLASLGKADLSAEEKAFAKKFTESFDEQTKRGTAAKIGRAFSTESPEKIQALAESPILEEIYPYFLTDQAMPASSDVGDASWHAPTAQFTLAAFPLGTNAHSWQWVSCGKSSVAHKSVVRAGKVIAMTALDLLEKPDLLEKAKTEYTKRLGGAVYKSPIPEEVKPEE
jgi:aminobenzoyl-glutamate utilization protein B